MESSTELIDQLGGYNSVTDKMVKEWMAGKDSTLVEGSWNITNIPVECVSHKDGIYFIQVGKVKHFGQGCACPMGGISRDFLRNLSLGTKEIAIIDTEAGVEHLARGVEKDVDLVLAVLDPSYESMKLSQKITDMAKEAGKPTYFVLNKTRGDSIEKKMIEYLGRERVVGVIGYDDDILQKGWNGEVMDISPTGIEDIKMFIERGDPTS